MPRRLALSVCIAALFCLAAPAAKRPLTIKDFDSWNAIANEQLSRDGKYLIYAVFPQEGDGAVIVRNLATGAEHKEPAGVRPAPPPPNQASLNPDERPEPRGISVSFTQDGKYVIFSTFASKADIDKAKKEKKSPEAMPKGGMVILDLATSASTRNADVKSFQVPEESSANFAYLKEGEAPAQPAGPRRGAAKRPEFGSPLVLRSLSTQAERTFPDVTEYTLSKDGKMLDYAVASKQQDTNGVFSVDTAPAPQPAPPPSPNAN